MHSLRSWTAGIMVMIAVAVVLGMSTIPGAQAQQPTPLDFNVTENRVPGADGTGTMTALPGNQLRVDVRLTGMPPNGEHAMHIHIAEGARCDTNAPIVYPLNNVRVDAAGLGTSTTTVTVRPDQPIRAGHAYVNVHQGPSLPSPGVICANIDATFTATAGAATPAMPANGVGGVGADHASLPWAIGALAVIVLLGGIWVRSRVRRC